MDECTQIAKNHRLLVRDNLSKLTYLIDTGANISVIPKRCIGKRMLESCDLKLYAANDSEIKTHGICYITISFGLRRVFKWPFIVCDVKQPIIGADFLRNFKLSVDLYNNKLVDLVTDMYVCGLKGEYLDGSIKCINSSHPYADLLESFQEITKPPNFKDIPEHSVFHHIETTGQPVHAKARRLPPHRYDKVRKEFQLMQELGICRPSNSAWASPLHVVPKKDGEIRPCGDYRMLNSITKPDRYSIPRVQDFTFGLHNKKVFSKIDLCRAYHFIRVWPDDVKKTAIITPFGLYEFPRMTFGLRNAAQTFQRFINNTVLSGIEQLDYESKERNEASQNNNGQSVVFGYLDDVIIGSDNEVVHRAHLRLLFERFSKYNMSINLGKCIFGKAELEFLGYKVSESGISPVSNKVEAITSYPKPETIEELRRFLGMLNFYRNHIPNAAKNQGILDRYLHGAKKKDKRKIEWTDEANSAFEQCKQNLINAATLSYPIVDAKLSLMTDASDFSIGGVLQQKENNTWKPLGYFSKRLTESQKKYSTYDKELLAIYSSIVYFRDMLEGRNFTVYTDHKPLTYAFTKLKSNKELPRRERQLLYISEFTNDIQHIQGSENAVADALSRIETITCATSIQYLEIAQAQASDPELANLLNTVADSNIEFKRINLNNSDDTIYCETSTKNIRPFIPKQFRKSVFENFHGFSHPGIKASRALICKKVFWPGMNKDIGSWVKSCIKCQKSKITRHTVSKFASFEESDRFEHLHIDIIGPLPVTEQGFRYCVTMIDRRTRWPEIYPIADMTAETVAKAVYEGWICRFGCPKKITTDQGRQFESELFIDLMKLLGVHKSRSSPYHPQCNGKIERWNKSLKVALTARLNDNLSWFVELPTVMLGLRAACQADSNFMSAAEFTLGHCLRLPGEFCADSNVKVDNPQPYITRLRDTLNKFRPKDRKLDNSNSIFVHADLSSCSHVFLRIDAVRRPLTPPYSGPYKVIERNSKNFKILINDKVSTVSVDRVKPAYIFDETNNNLNQQSHSEPQLINVNTPLKVSRSGRTIKRPVRFVDTYK